MKNFVLKNFEVALRKFSQYRSQKKLKENKVLWEYLQEYLARTKSTGCGYIDYYELYCAIRKYKPKQVLECGTGVTTLVIAHALKENMEEDGVAACVTSMEEHAEWLEMSKQLLPEEYHELVDFALSGTQEDSISLFRGVRYSELPEKNYDFVFVDGPSYVSPKDGVPTFDIDLLRLISDSEKPISGLIDKRVSTVFVLQQLLGQKKVSYSTVKGLGYVHQCSKHDLGNISEELSSLNFSASFRILCNSKLNLSPRVHS